jgi:hypothetical protein
MKIGECSFNTVSSDTDEIKLLAIEIWCTLAEEEIDRVKASQEHFGIIDKAQASLVQLLLNYSGTESDSGFSEWNIRMGCGTCMSLVSQLIGNNVVDPVINYPMIIEMQY